MHNDHAQGILDGKVVLVTGAAQGIGREVARVAADQAACLVLVDRAEQVAQVAEELPASAKAVHVLADLETWAGAEAAVAYALEQFDRIDVCINAVGGTIWARPFEHYDPEKIQAEITRSLFPTLWMTRAVLPSMKAQGAGTIVNVSSIATRGINRVPYSAAKGGVNALTSALAMEAAADGIRVVATAPGGTQAPARTIPRGPGPEGAQEQQWMQQVVDQTVDSTLMQRYGTLREQAEPIVFLASDAASYITGTVLPVGGGDQGM
ncbi:1,6-dihydroxycyclohexa-2,4-diene-1-carboxylate dehydrogenase [Enteractinococcus helveticum]|uniref:1,6-dihydroxycyclohexa-2,4-diene-1-carboxylate dehydrogenase n=2 Tax=Enteractinococcus helveticum TaxID=1837282 RepID=A0A1B7M060_9MICC|nr:1,6-dihydroxycyclohexa-2,4-diene-1-carboxylate dehydrogenase [Enteractinococcus helveticum]